MRREKKQSLKKLLGKYPEGVIDAILYWMRWVKMHEFIGNVKPRGK